MVQQSLLRTEDRREQSNGLVKKSRLFLQSTAIDVTLAQRFTTQTTNMMTNHKLKTLPTSVVSLLVHTILVALISDLWHPTNAFLVSKRRLISSQPPFAWKTATTWQERQTTLTIGSRRRDDLLCGRPVLFQSSQQPQVIVVGKIIVDEYGAPDQEAPPSVTIGGGGPQVSQYNKKQVARLLACPGWFNKKR